MSPLDIRHTVCRSVLATPNHAQTHIMTEINPSGGGCGLAQRQGEPEGSSGDVGGTRMTRLNTADVPDQR